MYNTASMLRTMELILGLRPMTHFDAAAMPMARHSDDAQAEPYEPKSRAFHWTREIRRDRKRRLVRRSLIFPMRTASTTMS